MSKKNLPQEREDVIVSGKEEEKAVIQVVEMRLVVQQENRPRPKSFTQFMEEKKSRR
jgi:hypothetical protein